MGFDIMQLSSPIGMIPEISLGEPLKGSVLAIAGHVSNNMITLDTTCNWPSSSYVIGMKLLIDGGGNQQKVYVEDYDENTQVATITPALAYEFPLGAGVFLYALPIPHRIEKFEPTIERNKSTYGAVGSGITKKFAYQGAEEVNISLGGIKGKDSIRDCIYSSFLAMAYSSSGVFDRVTGEVIFRAGSAASTVSLIWQMKAGEERCIYGCLLTSVDEEDGEDMDSLCKIAFEMSGQRRAKEFPTNVLPPEEPYNYPLLRSHGSRYIDFQHKTLILADYGGESTNINVGSVYGFAEGDKIELHNELGEVSDELTIDSVDEENRIIKVEGMTLDWYGRGMGSWLQHTVNSYKRYDISKMSMKTMTGHSLSGNIASNVPYRTNCHSQDFDIECKIGLKRVSESSSLYTDLQDVEAQYPRLIMNLTEYTPEGVIDGNPSSLRRMEFTIINQLNEPLSESGEVVIDELELKLIGDPNLSVYNYYPQ